MNLALGTPESERERTDELNVGYDPGERSWEVIVKYSGDLDAALAEQFPAVRARILLNGFAILDVPEGQVEDVIGLPQIEYAEKPKRLFFAVNQAKAASCLFGDFGAGERAGDVPAGLSGRGVLAAVIDSGIDYFHADFRNEDGSTRILYLDDQVRGRVYTKEEIDRALGGREDARALVPSVDPSGHGTAVAGIFAGNGRESGGKYRGVAFESDLLIVRLGAPSASDFPRTTQVMEGLDFVVRTAEHLGRPVAVNLSFGNTYGSHDGNGLLERFLDSLAERGRSVFVVGAGNEAAAGGHSRVRFSAAEAGAGSGRMAGVGSLAGSGRMAGPGSRQESAGLSGREARVELSVAPYEAGFGVQLWKSYVDSFAVFLTDPSRSRTEQIKAPSGRPGAFRMDMGQTEILVYYGEPGPFNQAQEIYLEFLPKETYVESGIWEFLLVPERIVDGDVDFWLPSAGARNRATVFLRPSPDTTLTIPSTALRPVTVGAYDDASLTYAPFSGRGNTRRYGLPRPDLAAPGVGIVTARAGGGYGAVTGTSFAAPFVAGTAALLMEWGIVRGNDPYLYGDKVKAYLKKGARPLPGYAAYPNPEVGYGALCAAGSLPGR